MRHFKTHFHPEEVEPCTRRVETDNVTRLVSTTIDDKTILANDAQNECANRNLATITHMCERHPTDQSVQTTSMNRTGRKAHHGERSRSYKSARVAQSCWHAFGTLAASDQECMVVVEHHRLIGLMFKADLERRVHRLSKARQVYAVAVFPLRW